MNEKKQSNAASGIDKINADLDYNSLVKKQTIGKKSLRPQIFMPFNLGRVSEYSATGKVHNMTKYL